MEKDREFGSRKILNQSQNQNPNQNQKKKEKEEDLNKLSKNVNTLNKEIENINNAITNKQKENKIDMNGAVSMDELKAALNYDELYAKAYRPMEVFMTSVTKKVGYFKKNREICARNVL